MHPRGNSLVKWQHFPALRNDRTEAAHEINEFIVTFCIRESADYHQEDPLIPGSENSADLLGN
jgi:hypothetical protein